MRVCVLSRTDAVWSFASSGRNASVDARYTAQSGPARGTGLAVFSELAIRSSRVGTAIYRRYLLQAQRSDVSRSRECNYR